MEANFQMGYADLLKKMNDARSVNSFTQVAAVFERWHEANQSNDTLQALIDASFEDADSAIRAHVLYGEALLRVGRNRDALKVVDNLIQSDEKAQEKVSQQEKDILASDCSGQTERAQTLLLRGDIHVALAQYDSARADYNAALQHFEACSNKVLLASALEKLGVLDFHLADYAASIEKLKRALDVFEQEGLLLQTSSCLSNLANCYWATSNLDQALECYKRALEVNIDLDNNRGVASNYSNLGNVAASMAQYSAALGYYQQAIAINERIHNKSSLALNHGNMGNVFAIMGEYLDAIQAYTTAMTLSEELHNQHDVGLWLGNIGIVYQDLGEFEKAREHYTLAMQKYAAVNDTDGASIWSLNLGNVFALQEDYVTAEQHFRTAREGFAKIGNAVGVASALSHIGSALCHQKLYPEALRKSQESLSLAREIGDRHTEVLCLITIATATHKTRGSANVYDAKELLLTALTLASNLEMKKEQCEIHHALSELYRDEGLAAEALVHFSTYHDLEKQLLHEEVHKKAKQLDAERRFNASEKQRVEAEFQRELSDTILHNMLPAVIAERIKNGEKVIADTSQNVSVLFADIVGFTKLSASISAEQLVRMLNDVFHLFDELALKHGLEKIKTIGDCYMVVGGLPVAREDHAHAVVRMGLDMTEKLHSLELARSANLNIRIGIHCGEVVAGVIGQTKISYDLWGDTVNTASRMESSGEAGKVHVSQAIYELIKDDFKTIDRGEVAVKSKGMMRTWFVER